MGQDLRQRFLSINMSILSLERKFYLEKSYSQFDTMEFAAPFQPSKCKYFMSTLYSSYKPLINLPEMISFLFLVV